MMVYVLVYSRRGASFKSSGFDTHIVKPSSTLNPAVKVVKELNSRLDEPRFRRSRYLLSRMNHPKMTVYLFCRCCSRFLGSPLMGLEKDLYEVLDEVIQLSWKRRWRRSNGQG